MSLLDWTIVLLYFVASAAVGVYYVRRAGSNLEEFFLSGRDLPWWLAGTSMVATTFAADTPLAVTELVAKNGIAGTGCGGTSPSAASSPCSSSPASGAAPAS